jgi:hypothetical protein
MVQLFYGLTDQTAKVRMTLASAFVSPASSDVQVFAAARKRKVCQHAGLGK